MKLAVVAMVRNEIDVAGAFLAHLASLFDVAVLLDHGSVDGTGALLEAACAGRAGWACWRVAVAGHHQALLSSFAMRHVFATTDADFVLFLDADEFIDVADRTTLERALAGIPAGRMAGLFAWEDCIPADLDGGTLAMGAALWRRRAAEPYCKVAVPRALYEATAGAMQPSSGNHTVEPRDGGDVGYAEIGTILHLPARSVAQLRQKVIAGTLAVLARRGNPGHESVHWFAMLAHLAEADFGESDLLNIAAGYGLSSRRSEARFADLPAMGFTPGRLDVAHVAPDLPVPASVASTWQVIAAAIRDWREEDGQAVQLVLEGRVLRAVVPPPSPAPDWETRLAGLERLLAAAQDRAARLQDDVSLLRASTSFRVTAPLRAAMRALRRQRGAEPVVRAAADVTVVVTSCGRHDLLAATLASFRAHNTDARVGEVLVVEDGTGDPAAACAAHGARLLRLGTRVGQVAAIDRAYAQVETALVFHLEDDWEFYRPGFMQASRAVLAHDPSCVVVSLRAWDDLNGHPLSFMAADRSFGVFAAGFRGIWHGFTWNPGLRRMADYRRIGRYGALVDSPADVAGQDRGGPEAGIGAAYRAMGYRAVVLDETGYVRHLGWGRTVAWTGPSG